MIYREIKLDKKTYKGNFKRDSAKLAQTLCNAGYKVLVISDDLESSISIFFGEPVETLDEEELN